MDLKGRHFLKLLDYTPEEIQYLLDLSADLKRPVPEPGALLKWQHTI